MKADLYFVRTGIYVPPTAQFPKHFHDIGVRIEDEVVVGERHPTVLTVSAPKEVSSVALACRKRASMHRERAPMHRELELPRRRPFHANMSTLQVADVEGACQGLLGLEPY